MNLLPHRIRAILRAPFPTAFAALALLTVSAVAAQTNPDSSRSGSAAEPDTALAAGALPEVVIEARRGVALPRVEILATGQETRGLDDLLVSAGLHLHTYTPGGGGALRVRGLDAAHTAIVLDGVRVSDPHTGQVNLTAIPTSFLEQAAIVRSGAADQGALGGTIALRTVQPETPADIRSMLGSGSYGRRSGALVLGHRGERRSAVLGLDVARSVRDYPISGGVRLGSGTDRVSAMTRFFGPGWSVQYLGSRVTTALPGPANGPPRRSEQEQRLHHVASHRVYAGPATAVRAGLGAQFSDHQFRDRDVGAYTRTRTARAGAELEAHRGAGGLRLEVDREWLEGTDAATWETNASLTLEQPWGGVTVAQTAREGGVWLQPRLWWQRGAVLVTVGRGVRQPTLAERFWQPGGNPELRPERGWTADATVRTGGARAHAAVTLFAARLKDRVVWHPSLVSAGLQIWRPSNVGRVSSFGVEARGRAEVGGITLTYDASWTDARDRSDPRAAAYNHALRYVPRLLVRTAAEAGARRIRFKAEMRHTGSRPIASDGSFSEPAFTVVDLSASRTLPLPGMEASRLLVRIDNALDADYAVVRLYPLPGRTLSAQLTLTL